MEFKIDLTFFNEVNEVLGKSFVSVVVQDSHNAP